MLTPLGLITPTTIKMTKTGTPNAIAVSGDDARLPIAKPSETEDLAEEKLTGNVSSRWKKQSDYVSARDTYTVIKQYVFINVPIDDRNPVNFFSTDAKIKAKLASSGISANTFASKYSRLE